MPVLLCAQPGKLRGFEWDHLHICIADKLDIGEHRKCMGKKQHMDDTRKKWHLPWRGDLVHMSTSAPFTFRIWNFLKSHTFIFAKIMALNIYIDMYKRSVREKVPLKNTLYLERYKIDKFLIVNSSKVVVK
jgi:hypothetical protein